MLGKDSLLKINGQLFYERCTSKAVRDFIYIFYNLDPNSDIDFALEMLANATDPVLRRAINVILDEITF